MIVEALGLSFEIIEGKGPVVSPSLTPQDIHKLTIIPPKQCLSYVAKAIQQLQSTLNNTALIGFAGGPITVANYILPDPQRVPLKGVLNWIQKNPEALHHLLQLLTDATIEYLHLQVEAGIDAFQLFDTWLSELPDPYLEPFGLQYTRQILTAANRLNIPVTFFGRNTQRLLPHIQTLPMNILGIDWHANLTDIRSKFPTISLQGNINPTLLLEDKHTLKTHLTSLLEQMGNDPGYILNLGHGVLPQTNPDNVNYVVNLVKSWTATS